MVIFIIYQSYELYAHQGAQRELVGWWVYTGEVSERQDRRAHEGDRQGRQDVIRWPLCCLKVHQYTLFVSFKVAKVKEGEK